MDLTGKGFVQAWNSASYNLLESVFITLQKVAASVVEMWDRKFGCYGKLSSEGKKVLSLSWKKLPKNDWPK